MVIAVLLGNKMNAGNEMGSLGGGQNGVVMGSYAKYVKCELAGVPSSLHGKVQHPDIGQMQERTPFHLLKPSLWQGSQTGESTWLCGNKAVLLPACSFMSWQLGKASL